MFWQPVDKILIHTNFFFFTHFYKTKSYFLFFLFFKFIYYFSPLQHRVSVNLKDDWTSEG